MSITASKTQLAEAIKLYDHLNLELNDKDNLEKYSEEEWQAQLRSLGRKTAQLIQISRTFDNESLLELLKKKQAKLVRHRVWKKRHKKRVQQRKAEIVKRNEKWIRDVEWKVSISPSVVAARIAQQDGTKTMEKRAEDQLKSKIKELSKQLSRLKKLRELRRKKLEAKGHFFADEGNAFFNQVKEWHESDKESIIIQTVPKEPIIHKDDTWKHIPIDKVAYKSWCEADRSIEALLKVRRLWDQYILFKENDEESRLHKVPPTFVTPAPPANGIWASYLL